MLGTMALDRMRQLETARQLRQSTERLSESEERYRTLFERAGDGIIVIDTEGEEAGKIVSANQMAVEMHGYDMEEFMSLSMSDLDTPEEAVRMETILDRVRQGEMVMTEHYHRRKDGAVLPIELSAGLIEMGDHEYSLSINRDITERKKAEEALRKSEEKYRHLYDNAELGLFQTRISDGKIIVCNQRIAEMTGYGDIGQFIEEYVVSEHYVDPSVRLKLIEELKRTGSVKDFEAEITDRWGTPRWWCYSVKHYPEKGVMEGSIMDITERKKAEEAIKQSVSLLTSTIESTADGILVVNREGGITTFNKRFQEMWGIPNEVMESGDDAKALDYVLSGLKEPQEFLNRVRDLYSEPGVESFDVIEFKDGRVIERSSRPQKKEDEIVGRVWSFRDVTDRKRAEEALRESENRYRLLTENASVGIWQIDQDDQTIFANLAMCELLEIESEEELVGKTFHEFFTQDGIETIEREHAERRDGKSSTYEVQIRGNLGAERTVTVSGAPLFSASGTLESTIGCFIDTTDLTRAQEALKESEQRLIQIIEFLPDAFFAIDREGRVTTWNLAMEKLTGVKAHEMLGKGNYEYALPFYGERRPLLVDLAVNRNKLIEDRYAFVQEEGDILISELNSCELATKKIGLFAIVCG
ncbi:PAS domain S-box protein [Thermodesulfobacteriota bacterium]